MLKPPALISNLIERLSDNETRYVDDAVALPILHVLRKSRRVWVRHPTQVYGTSLKGFQFNDDIRIPYPYMSLEYQIDEADGNVTERVISACEATEPNDEGFDVLGFWLWSFNRMYLIPPIPSIDEPGLHGWGLSTLRVFLPYPRLNQAIGNMDDRIGCKVLLKTNNQSSEVEVDYEKGAAQIAADFYMFLRILALYNCKNIVEDTLKTSNLVNNRRKKKGKEPIPPYSILTLPRKTYKSNSKSHNQTGRKMPKHWRCGHIHWWRTKKGRVSHWLPPTLVNKDMPGNAEKMIVL